MRSCSSNIYPIFPKHKEEIRLRSADIHTNIQSGGDFGYPGDGDFAAWSSKIVHNSNWRVDLHHDIHIRLPRLGG